MRLTQVRVRNFRGIKDLTVDLDETTVLIGENNTGKTAFLEAVRICLQRLSGRGRGPFAEYDYHLASSSSTPAGADPIKINLVFKESANARWDDDIDVALSEVVATEDDLKRIELLVTSAWQSAASEFKTEWNFLDANENPLPRPFGALRSLQRMAPAFYLSALRDASKHFISRGRFWRPFLGEAGVSDEDRANLEAQLEALNSKVIKSNQALTSLRDYLDEHAAQVVELPGEERVAISALPTQLFSLLSRAQLLLSSASGAKIPVELQGEGTQSLAVLLIFGAFLRNQLLELDPAPTPVIALEEPEAHLHPSAIRSLMSVVGDLPGQKIVSTHSGDLVGSVGASSIRRFAHVGGAVQSFRLAELDDKELRMFDSHVRKARGELLFARCWLLVEGETEVVLFEGAAEALGIDIVRQGVCCVQFAQSNVETLAKVANDLGIEWYYVLDDDSGKRKYESSVRRQLENAEETDRLAIPYKNVETMLADNGFQDIYDDDRGKPKGKPGKVALAVSLMTREGDSRPVPEPVKRILRKSVQLAAR